MVYCGKPSKACGECRLRRTKCDYKRPSCSQCVRAGRACKGYRDPSELMFRDEAEGLNAKRQRLKNSTSQKPALLQSSRQKSPVSKTIVLSESRPPSLPLAIPVLTINPSFSTEEQATCFFFENYVLGSDGVANGSFQFLPNVYCNSDIDSSLSDSLTALGLVGLAHFYKSSDLMVNAVFKYNSAMKTLSSQLRDMEAAKSDQTFISIMLLGYYEVNTCNSRQSMETWSKHMRGATALMQFRGKNSLRTPIGYQLFKQLRTQVIINSIHHQTAVPDFLIEWSKELVETTEQAHGTNLSILVARYANLRASMQCWNDYSQPENLISTAYELECDCVKWEKNCPPRYIYQSINLTERVDEVFGDHYDIYDGVWIATTWNHYRCARLLTNEIILDQLEHLYDFDPTSPLLLSHPSYSKHQMLESKATLMHLCEDICASVPYYLGVEFYQEEGSIRQLPKAVYANLLLWPLYAAGATWVVSDMMMSWVAGRLEWIANVMGIRQAAAHAKFLRQKKHLLSWDESSKIGDDHITPSDDTTFDSGSDNENVVLAYGSVEDQECNDFQTQIVTTPLD